MLKGTKVKSKVFRSVKVLHVVTRATKDDSTWFHRAEQCEKKGERKQEKRVKRLAYLEPWNSKVVGGCNRREINKLNAHAVTSRDSIRHMLIDPRDLPAGLYCSFFLQFVLLV